MRSDLPPAESKLELVAIQTAVINANATGIRHAPLAPSGLVDLRLPSLSSPESPLKRFGNWLSTLCGRQQQRPSTDQINFSYGGSKLQPASVGLWKLEPYVDGMFDNPVTVIYDDGPLRYLDMFTGQVKPWPVSVHDTGRGKAGLVYEIRNGVMSVNRSCSCLVSGHSYALFSPVSYHPNPSNPNSTLLVYRASNDMFIKHAHHSSWTRIPVALFDAIHNRYSTSSHVSASGIDSFLLRHGYSDDQAQDTSELLITLFGGAKGDRMSAYFTYPINAEEGKNEDLVVETKDYVTAECQTLLQHPATAPEMCIANERAAVVTRLQVVNPGKVEIPDDIIRAVESFAKVNCPRQLLKPISPEDVVARQKTALTRKRMEDANTTRDYPGASVDAFVKKEFYTSPKDPRNISGVCPDHNAWGFRYLYPVKDILKRLRCYGPGKAPDEVLEQLRALFSSSVKLPDGFEFLRNKQGAPICIEGDYSRFDGTQTESVRRLTFTVMRRWIHPDFHADFDALIKDQFSAVSRLVDGSLYDAMGSMLSGSWSTTDGNTLLNIIVVFTALIRLGMTPSAAMWHCGVAFGDDGLVREIKCKRGLLSDMMVQVGRDLGLKLVTIIRRDGVFGYLSRYYSVGRLGIIGSCPDIARLLPKFQLAVQRKADEEYFRRKYSSLRLLCGDSTPILSNYMASWFRLHRLVPDAVGAIELPYWLSILDEFELENVTFLPCDPDLRNWVVDTAAQELGMSSHAIESVDAAVAGARTIIDLNDICLSRKPAGVSANIIVTGDNFHKETQRKTFVSKPARKSRPREVSAEKTARSEPLANTIDA